MKKSLLTTLLMLFAFIIGANGVWAQTWDYTEGAPTDNPDRGLYYASVVKDGPGTKNGLYGIKMNSSGYAYFQKEAVAGTLKISFGPRDGAKASTLGIYGWTGELGSAVCDDQLIASTPEVTEHQTVSIDLTAEQNNIYIKRIASLEQVLTKLEFTPKTERTFQDFTIDFTTNPYTGTIPEGVTVEGTFHDGQHGYQSTVVTVPVDGTVKISIGGCNYTNQATISAGGNVLATLDTKTAGCSGVATYIYAGAATTLTINLGNYCPSLKVEACEVQPCVVTFKDQNGNVLGKVDKYEGDALGEIPYSEKDLTYSKSHVFRGWVYASGIKAKASDVLSGNTTISALVTPYEYVTMGSVQNYPLNSNIFYPEDHETINIEGGYYHDSQHGWAVASDAKISVETAGNAQIVLALCKYSKDAAITVTDAKGNTVQTIASGQVENDGATATVNYKGEATTLTFTWAQGESYIHSITVYNVSEFVEKDAESGYYIVPKGDGAAFLLALNSANSEEGAKIFLPNGTYDLGETVNTTISGKNMSIIGQGEVTIKNAPDVKLEGLGKADLLCNTSDGLYMQKLTLMNALDYYAAGSAGRACAFHDKGNHTACLYVSLDSYQDTYYSHKDGGYFYWNMGEIMGTVDYICGGGNVFFDNILLKNRSRDANESKGECTITAPYTAAADKGYVFQNCLIMTQSEKFNFGRSWKDGKCAFLNTKLYTDVINTNRWTTAGMNSAAISFKEYNTTLNDNGAVISPASNKLNFTHSTGNLEYETILTADEAKAYSYEEFFKDANWDPRSVTKQETATVASVTETSITMAEDGIYMIEDQEDDSFRIFVGKTCNFAFNTAHDYRVSKANARGGFGDGTSIEFSASDIKTVSKAEGSAPTYNLSGIQANASHSAVVIKNGKKILQK